MVSDGFSDCLQDRVWDEGFGDEIEVDAQPPHDLMICVAGNQDDGETGKSISDGMRQIDAIHFTGQFDIGDDDIHPPIEFLNDSHRLWRTVGFQAIEAFSLQNCPEIRADGGLVIY
jgi:hypothetical protein